MISNCILAVATNFYATIQHVIDSMGVLMVASKIELLCKTAYHKNLAKKYSPCTIEWVDLSKSKNDPPDFRLRIEDVWYAVEVTQFRINLESATGETINESTYNASMSDFVDTISKNVSELGCLSGTYVITFHNPMADFHKKKKDLIEVITKYIHETKDSVDHDTSHIMEANIKVFEIKKYHNKSNMVKPAFSSKWKYIDSKEHKELVFGMLKDVILDKKGKLENEEISDPKILLLFNSYPLANKDLYEATLSQYELKELSYFHEVFVVESKDRCYPIYSNSIII